MLAPVSHLRRVALTETFKKDVVRHLLRRANTSTNSRPKYLHQPKANH